MKKEIQLTKLFKTHDAGSTNFGVSVEGRAAEFFWTEAEAIAYMRGIDIGSISLLEAQSKKGNLLPE